MPTIVNLKLRRDSRRKNAPYEDVDLDKLTPRARTLAEAIAQTSLRTATDIWMESDKPLRETDPNWHVWYTEEQANQPEQRPWRGWSTYPIASTMTAIDYLESQAAKIPPGWHVLGASPDSPVPSLEAGIADRYLTRDQVLAYMRQRGRDISPSTWSSYTAATRQQAPKADRYVGRTPQWRVETIDAFLNGHWKPTSTA